MKRKNLMLTVAAAAVLGAFNPAFAGGGSAHDQEYNKEKNASVDAGIGADADITAGANVSPSAGDTSSPSSADSSVSATTEQGASSSMDQSADQSASGGSDPERLTEPDRLTGLDQAHPAN
jgi:hypothetical protein